MRVKWHRNTKRDDIYNMIRICNLWNSTGIQWQTDNLTWSECEMIQEICQVWSTTKFPWKMADWKWSECSSSAPPPSDCKVWGTTNVLWRNANWKWNECSSSIPPVPVVIIGNPPGVDAELLIQPWQLEEPWNPYITSSLKHKKLVKLICRVQGKKYEEEKEVKDFPVTVGDIRAVVKKVANIDLDFRLEE